MIFRLKCVRNTLLIVLSGLIMALAFSCDTGDKHLGMYQSAEHPEKYIELKENGVGVWRVIDDEASFRWDTRGSKLKLHTRAGGVVTGKIQNDTIQIVLPTQSIEYFKRIR
ncbi:MAG: hypothetical protein JRD93_04805 [Deltaproteobacteria bacterium]|nr:hypothetical protein [Deltaproteobacteria bacterium]MBW2661306.1 hypothetical protein [Deltaproteobacteria bacterium]